MKKYTEEEIAMIVEMTEMLEDMSPEEISDFIKAAEVLSFAKKNGSSIIQNNSVLLN